MIPGIFVGFCRIREGFWTALDYLRVVNGGGRGIRTPVTRKGKAVFKTAAINRSAIPPARANQSLAAI